jgi:hypothetical protein
MRTALERAMTLSPNQSHSLAALRKRHALASRTVWCRQNLQVIDIANLLAGVDVNPDRFHWSFFSFRRLQCGSLC